MIPVKTTRIAAVPEPLTRHIVQKKKVTGWKIYCARAPLTGLRKKEVSLPAKTTRIATVLKLLNRSHNANLALSS